MFTIHSKNSCPWCEKAKTLLRENGFTYHENLYQSDEEIANFKAQGFKTFPQIYTENNKLIGGYEALEDYLSIDDF